MMGTGRQGSELRDPQNLREILRYLLITPFYPHAGKPTGSDNQGASPRREARERIYVQVLGDTRRPGWTHARYIDSINHISSEFFRELGYCEHPLYAPLKVSEELPQLHNLVCARRMDYHSWTLLSGAGLPQSAAPQLAEKRRVVVRNVDDDCPRSSGRWAAPGAGPGDP